MALPDLSPFSLEYKEPAKPQLTTRIYTQQEKAGRESTKWEYLVLVTAGQPIWGSPPAH